MFKSFAVETGQACAVHAELIGSDQASAAGVTARSHAPVVNLCRQLLAAGINPFRTNDAALLRFFIGTIAVLLDPLAVVLLLAATVARITSIARHGPLDTPAVSP
jgi:hypothetical protein